MNDKKAEARDLQMKLEMGYTITAYKGEKAYIVSEVKFADKTIIALFANSWQELGEYDVNRPDHIAACGHRPSDWGYDDEETLAASLLQDEDEDDDYTLSDYWREEAPFWKPVI